MGNLEKLLVVGVLVVVIGILAVSLFWTSDVSRIPDYEQGATAEQTSPVSLTEGTPVEGGADDTLPLNTLGSDPLKDPNAMVQDGQSPIIVTTPPVMTLEKPGPKDLMEAAYKKYVVKSGDTLEKIALQELGSKNLVGEILKANEGLDPRKLRVGRTLLLPQDAALAQVSKKEQEAKPLETTWKDAAANPAGADIKSYTVKSGDTLWKISKKVYGDGARWKKILDANKDKLPSPEKLRVGMNLIIQ